MTPTPEQEAIITAVRQAETPIMVNAMAGCAKTTSLELLSKSLPMRPTLAVAFNVKIKKELEKRLPKHFEILTLNGLGHRAWGKAINRRCTVNTNKLFNSMKEAFGKDAQKEQFSVVSALVRGARQSGLIPSSIPQYSGRIPDDWNAWQEIGDSRYVDVSEESIYLARKTLSLMIQKSFAGEIDYDDQIYMSTMFGGVFPRFPISLVDEAQDLSPLNHIQLARSSADRIIVCGDPRQAIYAFRGADSSSMESLRLLRSDWIDRPLSMTFRCPKLIVSRQQEHAPGFNAHSTAPEGELHDLRARPWSIADIEQLSEGAPIAILCRNNAPIIAAALRIIRSGRGCTVLGSEIGKSLVTLSKKIIPDDGTSAETCVELIRAWAERETSLARANEKEERVAIIRDRAECLLAVIDSGNARSAGDLRNILGSMFQKENLRITLSTGHKSKGLEWPYVVHLDAHRIPSRYAKMALDTGDPIPYQQDMNLRYVIETRVQKGLILADLEYME